MVTVSLLGFGTIGREIARAVAEGTLTVDLVAVLDNDPDGAEEALAELFDDPPRVVSTLPELAAGADLVVEAAGGNAVQDTAVDVLEGGTDLMVLSVGALADESLREEVESAARRNDADIYVPSGAIAGLDAIKAAAITGELDAVSLATTKPPAGLAGAPYVEENDVDLDVDEPTAVFEGSAKDAAAAFPSNINVAMALSLAGIGPERTTVRIVADPDEENNVHHIEATGGMGTIETTVRNVPSPTNPKTSYLAAVSAIERLRGIEATVKVGT